MRGFTPLMVVLVLLYSVIPGQWKYLLLPVIFVVMCVFLYRLDRKGRRS